MSNDDASPASSTTSDDGPVAEGPQGSAPRGLRVVSTLLYVGGGLSGVFGVVIVAATLGDDSLGAVSGALLVLYGALLFGLAGPLKRGSRGARTAVIVLTALALVSSVARLAAGYVDLNLIIAPAILWELLGNRTNREYFARTGS